MFYAGVFVGFLWHLGLSTWFDRRRAPLQELHDSDMLSIINLVSCVEVGVRVHFFVMGVFLRFFLLFGGCLDFCCFFCLRMDWVAFVLSDVWCFVSSHKIHQETIMELQ